MSVDAVAGRGADDIQTGQVVVGFYSSFGRVATVLEVEIEPAHGTAVIETSEKAATE